MAPPPRRPSPIVPPEVAQQSISFESVGSPPSDPLAAAEWMFKLLIAAADDVRRDQQTPARERRRELLAIASEMRALVPRQRIYQAEQAVKNDDARVAEQGLGGPELQDAAQVGSGSRGPAPRRGRPPKRSLR